MKRDLLLDSLKLLAIILVVVIHLPEVGLGRQGVYPIFANAVFATLSGMFIFKGGNFKKWLKRRWHRLVLPYLVWELVYVILGMCFDVYMNKFNSPSVNEVYHWIFWGDGSVHLWFIVTLFYVQLILWLICYAHERWLRWLSHELILIVISLVCISCFTYGIGGLNVRRMVFMMGFCSLGILLRVPYNCLVGNRFLRDDYTWAKYLMGVYLCHFLFTRIASMLYSFLCKIMPHVLVLTGEIIFAFGASWCFVCLSKQVYWLWGMRKDSV